MKTQKIVFALASMLWLLFVAAAFSFGDVGVGLTTIAIPLVVPVIKSADISDTEKLAQELNKVFGELSNSIKAAIADEYKEKGAMSLVDIDAKLKKLGIEEKTLADITSALELQSLAIEKGKSSDAAKFTLAGMMKTAFAQEGLLDQIKQAFDKQGNGLVDVTKQVGNITTGQVTTDTGGNALLDMLNADEIADIRLSMPFIEDFSNVSNTSKPVFTYVDYIPGEGDVAFLAEGTEKAQIDLDIQVKTVAPVKAAGYEILTEESITDIPRLESNARGILFRKYLLKRQNGILFGDGIGANPTGVTKIASLFNPATWVGEKVKNPNLHDVIIALANQIYTTLSYTDDVEYFPNVVFVNPADFAALRISKDANGQYLFPSFTIFNDKTIDGMRVVAKNKIPAGKILIGDFKKLNIVDYVAYSVRIGWINDQFIKNLFTMLGEGRFFVYVKSLDQRAFVYDDITNVVAGIEEVIA